MSEEQAAGLLAEGIYKAKAVGGEITETKGGHPSVTLCFDLYVNEVVVGRRYWNGFFTEKTELRTMQSLKYAGFKGSDLSDLSSLGSCECSVVIGHETYEDVTRDKIQWVNGLGMGDLKNVMEANKKKAFAASMKAKMAAVQAGTAKKSAPAEDKRPEPPPTGDLPF